MFLLYLVAVLVTTSWAQTSPDGELTWQHRAELQRPSGVFAYWATPTLRNPGAAPFALQEGLAFAKQSRSAEGKLIIPNPALTWSSAIGSEVRNALPLQIQTTWKPRFLGTDELLGRKKNIRLRCFDL